MTKLNFFAVGHITNDLEPKDHLGGGVAYSAVAAHRLGMDAHVVTKCPTNHPYIQELEGLGVLVHRLPTGNPDLQNNITSFRNFYDEHGNRKQIVSKIQEKITKEDLPQFPQIPKDSIVLVAPVFGEVEYDLFPILSENRRLFITPQGYFRRKKSDGEVYHDLPESIGNFLNSLSHSAGLILSDEDLTFEGRFEESFLKEVRSISPLVVLTKGERGQTIYQSQKEPQDIRVLPLSGDEIVDPTGAGDSSATAFIWHYETRQDAKEAGVFAALYAALKIMGIGGREHGIPGLPTLEQVQNYISSHPERYNNFLRENALATLTLEGISKQKERG
ncbi:hypothetical protein HYT33_03770 [Candidatus Roizmanbacteria bacterium]|nr:hypothetical protein [Candidatus Roizmanbacteria bacterium]